MMANWIIEYEDWTNYEAETKENAIQEFRNQYRKSATINRIIKDGE